MNAKAGLANLITGTRILCSAALLFCPAFSAPFYVLYLMAGLTDMVDGAVARKTGTVSTFGAKLDMIGANGGNLSRYMTINDWRKEDEENLHCPAHTV